MLVKKIAETVRSEVSYSKIHGSLKGIGLSVSRDTVIDYITYAKEAYLLFSVQNGFFAFSDRESTPKYYYTDNGLLNLFLFDKRSILLENLIATELRRRYGDRIYYMKSSTTGIDVDFYLPEQETAIQVCMDMSETSFEHETQNLLRLKKKMPQIQRFLIVTMGNDETLQINGQTLRVMPASEFLLTV